MTSTTKPILTLIHLGCEKNRVDSEHMLGLLRSANYEISPSVQEADIVIVNTCSFIAAAREEAINTIMEVEAQNKQMIICGCLAQHFKSELLKEIPSAAAIVGTSDYASIVSVVEQTSLGKQISRVSTEPTYIADDSVPRIRTSNKAIAWLKVAEGCNCRCAFCIIPTLRGKHRSRPIESIKKEAEQYAKEKVKELILISQNTTNYGIDLNNQPKLPELLNVLSKVDIPWIRIMYKYPTGITADLLQAIKENHKVLRYFDIPFQHSHPTILKAMRRPFSTKQTYGIIENIRKHFPEAVLRTTFIVGFPGETDAQFKHLLSFIKEIEFDHVGVFCYSDEPDSKSFNLPHKVRQATMEKRKDAIMVLQQGISRKKNRALHGSIAEVLVEKAIDTNEQMDDFTHIGRSSRFAPEVDGNVYIKGINNHKIGEIIKVKIIDSDIYDLYAEAI